ncbi:MAG: ABC transporter substrate-binding protein [Gemmatimonadaceae bacterium]
MRRGTTHVRAAIALGGTILALGCGSGGQSVADDGRGTASLARSAGFDGDSINVGILSPLSDAVAVIGIPLTNGNAAYFSALNERGGVAGKYPVRLLQEDITYANPSSSVQKYNKIKNQVVLFTQILGTDHVNGLLPLLAEDSIVGSGATLDAAWIGERNLIPVAAPYQILAINVLDHYLNSEASGKNICSLALATGYGEAGLQGLAHAARTLGFQIASQARFKQGDQEFVAQVSQLKNAGCNGVLLVSLPSETGRIMGAASQLDFKPRWMLLSPGWIGALAQSPAAPYMKEHLWISMEGPQWGDTTVAGMATMLADMAKYKPEQKPDFFFQFGYTQARAAHAVLEKAVALGNLSRSGVLQAMAELGVVSNQGVMGDYGYGLPENRQPPRVSTVFKVNPSLPYGVELVKGGIQSPAATSFAFK